MTDKRKILISGMGCLLAACLSVGATSAYIASTSSTQNKFSVGKDEIQIIEKVDNASDLQQEMNYTKDVAIKNTGDVPCYIRVFLDFSDSKAKDVSQVSADGVNYYTWSDFLQNLPEKWTYISLGNDKTVGGYFYYKDPVSVGGTTTSLLKNVKTTFKENEEKPYDIIVYAESVQTVSPDADGVWKDSSKTEGDYEAVWRSYLLRADAVNAKEG